jgi:hypothetical protein
MLIYNVPWLTLRKPPTLTPFLRELQLHIGSYFLVSNQRRHHSVIDVDGIES